MPSPDFNELIAQVATGGLKTREQAASRLLQIPRDRLVDLLYERIEDRDFAERNAAIEIIGRLGPLAWNTIESKSHALSVEGKMFVAPAIAEFRDRRTLPLLHEWARSDDPNLSATVCEALGVIGDPSSIEVLQEIASADIWMAGPAISALGRIGNKNAVPFLANLINDEDLLPFVVSALATIPDESAWGPVCEGARADPTLVGIILDYGENLLKALTPDQIRAHATPKNSWIFEAREGLKNEEARITSAIVLGALFDEASSRQLIDLYLFDTDDDHLREVIAHLSSAKEYLLSLTQQQWGDEATRRLVSLLAFVTPESFSEHLTFLAHPSASVRLETVLALYQNASEHAALLTSLLTDPDELVRKTSLQVLRDLWTTDAVAQQIADEIDFDSLPHDVLALLTKEAPKQIRYEISKYLNSKTIENRQDRQTLKMMLEMRSQPGEVVKKLREGRAKLNLTTDEITALVSVDDKGVLDLIGELMRSNNPGTQYLAAETLVAHPLATQEVIEIALREAKSDGMIAALSSFDRCASPREFAKVLSRVSANLSPEAELAVLQALRQLDPSAGRSRFERATESEHWFLQLEGWRGLKRLSRHPSNEQLDALHEVAQAQLQDAP